MTDFRKRLSNLEKSRRTIDLKTMTDAELDAYINSFETVTLDFVIALTTQINRHGSTLPIVHDDPELPSKKQLPV